MCNKNPLIGTILVSVALGCSEDGRKDVERAQRDEADLRSVTMQVETPPRHKQQERARALRIGVIGPESGKGAYYGRRILEGVMLAAETFNAGGGIKGEELEVVHFDNKGDPELTIEGIEKLIEQRVIAILAAPTGWSTFSATHIANGSQTILVAIGTRRRIDKSGPYVFRLSLADETATDELIRFSTEEFGFSEYALITSSDYDYSLDLSSLFRRAVSRHGAEITVVADTYDTYSGKRDVDGVIETIKSARESLDAVIYTGGDAEGALLAQKIKSAGLSLPIIGGEDLYTDNFLKTGGVAAMGALVYSTFAADSGTPAVESFVQSYKDGEGKRVPDRFVALAYDSFMLVAEAVRRAGSSKTSLVRDALTRIRYKGVTGETRFSADGTPVKNPFIYMAEGNEGGERFVLIAE